MGDWSDGAENSVFNEIHGGTYDDIRYSAAVKGNAGLSLANRVYHSIQGKTGNPVRSARSLSGGMRGFRQALDKVSGIQLFHIMTR